MGSGRVTEVANRPFVTVHPSSFITYAQTFPQLSADTSRSSYIM